MMQNPGFHFFFVLGKGKNGRLLGYGQEGGCERGNGSRGGSS